MNKIFSSFLLLALNIAAFSQNASTAKQYKRVSWTNTTECLKADFSEDDLKKNTVVCDSFIRDGANIKIIKFNDTILSVIIGDDGDYLIADTLVINNSKERLLVNPEHATMFFWKSGDTKQAPEVAAPISGEKIAKKIRNRIAWANALGAIGAGMQTQTATVDTSSSGTVMATGSNGSSATGIYSGTSQSTITTQNTQAQVQEAMTARDRTAKANSVGNSYVAMALKGNTLFEKQSTSGLIYFKRTKAKFAIFTIELGDVLFDFAFTNPK